MKVLLNNKSIFIGALLFIIQFISVPTIVAQPELTGFFDVINTYNFTNDNYSQFQINQFEMDASYSYHSHFSLGTAVAYNPDTQNMELAMAYVHYNFINKETKHPRREEKTNHTGIIIGKFDINFGLDYLSFASPDRPIINQPLIYEKTIGAWNDTGIGFHIVFGKVQFNSWIVNGFYGGVNLGGNLRYLFSPSFSIGVSHSSDFEKINNTKANLTGADFIFKSSLVEIKGEYLLAKGIYEAQLDRFGSNKIYKGFYMQALTNLNEIIYLPFFATLQYGKWQAEVDRDKNEVNDYEDRFTIGVGYQFHDNVSARVELLSNRKENKEDYTKGMLQLVVAF